MIRKRDMLALLPVLVLLVWSAQAAAAPLTLRIDTEKAAINEYFQLTVQVNARHVQLVVPSTDDFRVVDVTSPFDQPMFCMNMGTSVVSGPCVFKFRLYPNKAGTLAIPEFQIVDDFFDPGRVVGRSEPFEVDVSDKPVDSDKSKQPTPGKGQRSMRGGRSGGNRGHQMQQPHAMQSGGPAVPQPTDTAMTPAEIRDLEKFASYDIFLLPVIKRDFVYLNEPFGVDFLLYVGENSGASSIQGLELPDLEGFRKEEVEVRQSELPRATIGGRSYQVFLLSRYVLLPMEAGKRTLTPATAVVLASSSSYQQFGGSGFAITFSSGSQPLEVISPPINLEVREAPPGAPEGFDPANIGRFTLRSLEVPPPQPAGSWVVLKFEIAGDGNLLTLALPTLSANPDIETRSSAVDNEGVKLDELGIHGSLKVQIPVRIKRVGKLQLPPLRLVSFDPQAGEYRTAELPLPELLAEAPKNEDGSTVAVPSEEDIEGIVTDVSLDGDCNSPRSSAVVWVAAWAGGIPALYLLLLLVRMMLRLSGRDNGKRQARQAMAGARRELAVAGRTGQGGTGDFYAAVSRALALCLEGRFRIPASATVGEVESELARLGVPPDLARQVREEIENAQFGRFAPTALQQGDMQATVRRVGDLLDSLERVRLRSGPPDSQGRRP